MSTYNGLIQNFNIRPRKQRRRSVLVKYALTNKGRHEQYQSQNSMQFLNWSMLLSDNCQIVDDIASLVSII